MSSPKARLTEGSVGRHLAAMTGPMIAGILAMMAFNLAEIWFVARLGTAELAAISFTFPVIMVLSSMAIGLGAGTSSVLARAIGRGHWPRVQRLATDGLVLAAIVSVVLAAVGYLTIDPLFRLLGASDEILVLISQYMRIWYISAIFLIVPMVGLSAIRATGDTRIPSMVMMAMSLFNLILDPLLIFGLGPFPRLELEGAALASLIARSIAFVVTLLILHFKANMLTRNLRSLRDLVSSWKEVLHVGLPAAGTNAIIPISAGVVTAMLATYGQSTVAGFGVATRVESVMLIIFYALSAVIGPFVGQNLGSGDKTRVHEAIKLCTIFSLGLGLALALLLLFVGRPLAAFFDPLPEVVNVAGWYFLLVPISYGTAAMVMIMNATFNGLGKPLPAVVVSVNRVIIIYLPLALLGQKLFGYPGIFAAFALSNVICGIGAYLWVRHTINHVEFGTMEAGIRA